MVLLMATQIPAKILISGSSKNESSGLVTILTKQSMAWSANQQPGNKPLKSAAVRGKSRTVYLMSSSIFGKTFPWFHGI